MSTSVAIAAWVLGSSVLDFIVPWDKPRTAAETAHEEERKSRELGVVTQRLEGSDRESLKQTISDLTALLDRQADRRSSVDTRLSTIVGLASIAGTITVGIIIAQLGGTLKISGSSAKLMLSVASLYLVVQLCDAVYWAVRGQSRRQYDEATAIDCVPDPSLAPEVDLRQHAAALVKRLHFNQESVNAKVTAMAVAHRAAANFAAGLLALSVAAVLMAARGPADSVLLDTLRNDSELRQLLRGPAGPQGPTGPAGPTGPQGAKGERGPPVSCAQPGHSNHTGSQTTQCHPG